MFKIKKKLSFVKKAVAMSGPALLIIIILAGAVGALVSAIAAVFIAIFDPLINSDKYQTEGVYNTISNYGGAYKLYSLDELTKQGLDKEIVEYVFKQEFDSYDSYSSSINIPVVSESDYNTWMSSFPSKTDDVSDITTDVDALWDLNEYTYPYRTHWQYLVAVAAVMSYEDGEEFAKAVEAIADKVDEEGKVKDAEGIRLNISTDDLLKIEGSMREHDMWTQIKYYTNYASDYQIEGVQAGNEDIYFCGDTSSKQINGYSFVNYNYNLFKTNMVRKDEFDENGVCTSMRYSTLPMFNNLYNIGNGEGEYSYITNEGYLYPAVLVKEASNWLCRYYDYDYVKVKEGNNTHYVLTTYKKKYRIADILKQWEACGVNSSMYEFVFDFLQQIQDSIGGTIATEFREAYEYYEKYGSELEKVYVNPAFPLEGISGIEITDFSTYGKEITAKLTNATELTKQLRSYYRGPKEFFPSIGVGQRVAQALYDNSVCYQPSSVNHVNAGYQCAVFNDVSYQPIKGWGNKAYDYGDAGTAGSGINDRVGLSSAGYVNYILRYSLFGYDYKDSETAKKLTATPTISEIYNASHFKFRNADELQPGDIALLDPYNNDDTQNVIAYYVGESEGNHIFYALNPTGAFNSDGTVRKVCLKGEKGGIDITPCNLTYFCRFYYGCNDSTVNIYCSKAGLRLIRQYEAVLSGYNRFNELYYGKNHIDYQDECGRFIVNCASDHDCTGYTDEAIWHVLGGIMPGGVGDDRWCGLDLSDIANLDEGDSSGALLFPVSYDDYTCISSWYSWRNLNGSMSDGYEKWHDGLDIAAPVGTPIVASASGKVTIATSGYNGYIGQNNPSDGGGYGNYVLIDHGSGVTTRYAHMLYLADGIAVGSVVERGQIIGYVGNSGSSFGYHVHFEVTDGKRHALDEDLPFPERGKRPVGKTATVDPYSYFPELDGSNKVASDISGIRPVWFPKDRDITGDVSDRREYYDKYSKWEGYVK